MYSSGKTEVFGESLFHIDNLEDLKRETGAILEDQKEQWVKTINGIIAENGYTQTDLAKICEVSKATVTNWLKGSLPQNREAFIKVGFAAKYDLKQMNKFLQRIGRYYELYPKSIEDSVYIFVLNSDVIEHSYAACSAILKEVNEYVMSSKDTGSADRIESYDTELVMNYILNIKEKDELAKFINSNKKMFKSAFNNFYDYVISFLKKNNYPYMDLDNPDLKPSERDNNDPENVDFLADTLNWSESLRKCMYQIKNRKWIPLRNKVISLGINLNMNIDELNQMLKLAKMEQLYVINPVECIIKYAVIDADLREEINDGTHDLYRHVASTLHEMGIEDEEYNLADL